MFSKMMKQKSTSDNLVKTRLKPPQTGGYKFGVLCVKRTMSSTHGSLSNDVNPLKLKLRLGTLI